MTQLIRLRCSDADCYLTAGIDVENMAAARLRKAAHERNWLGHWVQIVGGVAVVCAWCEAKKPETERDTRPGLSHGICPSCLAEMKAQIQTTRHVLRCHTCHARIAGTQNLCTRETGHAGEHRCSAHDVDARTPSWMGQ